MFRRFLPIVLPLAIALPAMAQPPSAATIVAKVEAAQHALKDVTLRLKGQIRQGGKLQEAEIEVMALPGAELRRITFLAPSALEGNVIVLDHATVYRYLALPNQVFVSSAEAAARNAPMDFSRFANILDGNLGKQPVKLLKTETLPEGKADVIEVAQAAHRFRLWVLEGAWRPAHIQAMNSQGEVQADWNVAAWKPNTGLTAATLKNLPQDAEVIRR